MKTGRFVQLASDAWELLEKLAAARGVGAEAALEDEIRRAAADAGLTEPETPAFLEIEAVEETDAIGPEGRGRRLRLKAIDETGEQDIGELFLPTDPDRGKKR